MIDKKKLKKQFSDKLKTANFKLKSNAWYKENKENIIVVELQKSNYSESYFLNIAVWLKALGEDQFPKERYCHIRMRADSYFTDSGAEIDDTLDFSETELDAEKSASIDRLLLEKVLPLSDKLSSIEGLKVLYRNGEFENVFLHKNARELLS
jgi:hypothetical protein